MKTTLIKYPTLQLLNRLEEEVNQLFSLVFIDSFHKEESIYSIKYLFKDLPESIMRIFAKWQKMNLGSLEWYSLSSGEYALLSMFSRIFNASKQIEKNTNLVLLLIDEGELYFHPQWQKEWITVLIECLNKIFEKHNIFIQVILTTHSPFLLSDVPTNRVLFLENYGDEVNSRSYLDDIHHTFGANINYLYTHSFFLKGSLMGDFSKNKINEVAQELLQIDKETVSTVDWDRFEKFIHQIGEPILKARLVEMFDQKRKLLQRPADVEEQIIDLQRRIEELEKVRDDKK